MRFMTLVFSRESSGPPPRALMDAITQLTVDAARTGALVDTGGLLPTQAGARVQLRRGAIKVTDGPFAEAKEVVGGFAVYEMKSKQEAIDASVRFLELHKEHWPGWEGDVEIRQMFDAPAPAPAGSASAPERRRAADARS
ncbi:MAG TPA: YciI family protein [Gemmatimonadaceae bacterium]|nr:YciI family protein [Gemmatimonadaceae bacterium]